MAELRSLYPETEPFATGRLRVSELHELYFEQAGNPQGKPVVFLHGGPGGGIVPVYRRVFDPELYHIVLLDQRGCGRSTPAREVRDNTTAHIVADLEALREYLGIPRWQVFGGSWGGTLALAYSQAHPDSVTEIVIRGPSPWRDEDMAWEFGGARMIWPECWERFSGLVGQTEPQALLQAYWELLNDSDEAIRRQAAEHWGEWEFVKCTLEPLWDASAAAPYIDGLALIECLYCKEGAFLQPHTQLLDDMHRIAHIPGEIIIGRYDIITPAEGAWEISKRWPAGAWNVLPLAGHSFMEPAVIDAMIRATDRYAGKSRGEQS